jgi:hypothetical protein
VPVNYVTCIGPCAPMRTSWYQLAGYLILYKTPQIETRPREAVCAFTIHPPETCRQSGNRLSVGSSCGDISIEVTNGHDGSAWG